MSVERISTPNEGLIAAAESGQIGWVDRSIKAGAQINSEDRSGKSPLVIASSHGHLCVVKHLLEVGADERKPDGQGNTPLICAAKNGHWEVVNELLKATASIDHVSGDGHTALTFAARNGHVRVVESLANMGSQLEHQTGLKNTALTIAACFEHVQVAKALLRAGANVDHMNGDGYTALSAASRNGQLPLVTFLLEARANVSACDIQGNTALHLALINGHMDVARQLMEYGADVTVLNKAGRTALDYVSGNIRFREELLEYDKKKRIAIMWYHRHKGITRTNLLQWLRKDYIVSLEAFVFAHRVLVWVVKRGILGLQELRWLGGHRDYLLEEVYMPVSDLLLSDEKITYIVSPLLSFAEAAGFICTGQGAVVKLAFEVRRHHRYVERALQALRNGISELEGRVTKLENRTSVLACEFKKVAENNTKMVNDMITMSESLKDLHALLKKQQRCRAVRHGHLTSS